MSAKISDLQERQIVNIADGKCLGNIKDIELNILEGTIQALVLPGIGGFWGMLQNQGELLIPWQKVVRIGVDVVLIDMPELAEDNQRCNLRNRRRRKEEPAWQQEVAQYQQEFQQGNIIVLPPEDREEFS
ncbi:MAG: YlmC/YmxH family sporulation protein [Peptococcaceae bacterium]|nr:YlmC/YmxH family sporulation protein [Peptococcaceae bacterium]